VNLFHEWSSLPLCSFSAKRSLTTNCESTRETGELHKSARLSNYWPNDCRSYASCVYGRKAAKWQFGLAHLATADIDDFNSDAG